jgi:hypothetical protein
MTVSFGSTLFSFTNEWLAATGPVEELLHQVAAHGLGPDLEVDGLTSFRGLPVPDEPEISTFRDTCASLGLRPTVFGVYVDRARRKDRWLDVDESVAELEPQLEAAHRLGFPMVRAAIGLDLAVVERVLPTLSALGLVLTLEVQGTMTLDSPPLAELHAWLRAHERAPVGLTFDMSVSMPDLPPSYRGHLRRLGMTAEVEQLLDLWWAADGPAHARFAGFRTDAGTAGASQVVLEQAVTAFVRMGRSPLGTWTPLLPWVRHVHAKFWDWELPDEHVIGPHTQALALLNDAGYSGSVSSEWGGSEWLGLEDVDTFELVGDHLSALRGWAAAASLGHERLRPEQVLT